MLSGRSGSLADQVARMQPTPSVAPRSPRRTPQVVPAPGTRDADAARELEFFNGLGGFSAGGREYGVVAPGGATTPVPWINVIANPAFGFHVSADGAGYTWARNSRENANGQAKRIEPAAPAGDR